MSDEETFHVEPSSALPSLDDLPRREPPPTDEELGEVFATTSTLYLPSTLAWTIVGELAVVILLLTLLLIG